MKQKNQIIVNLLLLVVSLFTNYRAFSQTVIFSENFESGGTTFTLNTTDVSSTTTNDTRWVINNAYAGGSATFTCLGFPFTINANATPTQPGAITNSPTSTYLHINSQAAAASGVNNCNYLAADGICTMGHNVFARMTNSISTVGFSNVNFNFWWICAGSAEAFGQVYYSINNGVSWVLLQSNFNNNPNWTSASLSNPALDNQANLRFGFRFVNTESFSGADPAFGVDQIEITGVSSVSNTINTGSVNSGPYCPGDVISVPFSSSGTFNAGNVYTAQLSDVGGNFNTPVNIGTLSSTSNSGIITATIPTNTPPGTNYLIQVTSSAPSVTGTNNGVSIIVNGTPNASISASTSTTICINETASFNFSGSAGTIQWQQSSDGVNFTNVSGANSTTLTTAPLTANTHIRAVITNNCGTSNSNTILVTVTNGVTTTIAQSPSGNNLCNGPITLSIPSGFINIEWSNGQLATSTIVVTTPGTYTVTALTTGGCPVTSNSVTLIETIPTPLLVSPEGPITLCSGSVNLTAQSGFTNYTWNSGQSTAVITVSSGGNYVVSAVDDNGCPVTSQPVEVLIGSAVPMAISPENAAICSGNPAILTAPAGFVSYQWSNNATSQSITVTEAGFYSVTGVDANGCNGASPAVSVVKSEFPVANFNYNQVAGFTIQFNNTSQNAQTTQWIFDAIGSSPSLNPQFSFPGNGVYNVMLIISNPCGIDTIVKNIVVMPLGFQGTDALGNYITTYPNPFENQLFLKTFDAHFQEMNFFISDLSGKILRNGTLNMSNETTEIQTSDLHKGLYLLTLQSDVGRFTFKLIKS